VWGGLKKENHREVKSERKRKRIQGGVKGKNALNYLSGPDETFNCHITTQKRKVLGGH